MMNNNKTYTVVADNYELGYYGRKEIIKDTTLAVAKSILRHWYKVMRENRLWDIPVDYLILDNEGHDVTMEWSLKGADLNPAFPF